MHTSCFSLLDLLCVTCFRGRVHHCLWIIFLDEGEVPCPRSFHAITSIGTSIYIFGGCGPGFFHKQSFKQNLKLYLKIKQRIIKKLILESISVAVAVNLDVN